MADSFGRDGPRGGNDLRIIGRAGTRRIVRPEGLLRLA